MTLESDSSAQPISYEVKSLLAWMTASQILLMVDDPLRVAVLHPGGGTYDCLALLTPDGQSQILMNRLGESALVNDEVIADIWSIASTGHGPHELAYLLLSESNLGVDEERAPTATALSTLNIANWLNHQRHRRAAVEPLWWDSSGAFGSNVNTTLLSAFRIPGGWLRQPEPIAGTDPSAWLFALVLDDSPIAIVNMRTGETVDADGSRWNNWPELSYREDGNLGCPTGTKITAYLRGEHFLTAVDRVTDVWRTRKILNEEYCDPIEYEPYFEMFPGFARDPIVLDPSYLD